MDNLSQPDQGPGDFAARFTAQQQDSTAQSRQLFSDFRDFCEGVSRRMDSLHAAYEAFPGAIGLRAALAPTAVIIKIMGQKSKEGLPGIDQSISTLGNPGPDTSEAANRGMRVNLRTIPDYIKGTRIMHKMLKSTVDIARQWILRANGWITAQPRKKQHVRNGSTPLNPSSMHYVLKPMHCKQA